MTELLLLKPKSPNFLMIFSMIFGLKTVRPSNHHSLLNFDFLIESFDEIENLNPEADSGDEVDSEGEEMREF